ncbi:MAG: hypothetical protein QOI20_3277 [Acidimicrobiaceae bacterium]|jgi:hypothetical protein|nr:hypothetical protein [Acidimicrobiaceae bacterium]
MGKIDTAVPPVNADASGDLTAKIWRFGKYTATGVAACSVLGERADGIIGGHFVKAPTAGDAVDFYTDLRPCKVQVGAAVAKGAELTPNANGDAITAVATNIVAAKAMEAAGAAGAIITVLPVARYAKP